MAQSIIKNHSTNTITSNTDECFYVYNNEKWIKSSNNYYKYYDFDVASIDVNAKDSHDNYIYNIGDYFLSYSSKINYLLFSENFSLTDSSLDSIPRWKDCGLYTVTNEENYRFPNTGKISPRFQTDNNKLELRNGKLEEVEQSGSIEHSLTQTFNSNANELNIISCMVKQPITTTNNVALVLFVDTYNIGISAKYNLNDLTGFNAVGYKEVPVEYIDKNCNVIQPSSVISHMGHISAGIYKINESESKYYFRLVIKASSDFNSLMAVKLMILNNNSQYLYSSKSGEPKYTLYVNAFQLEKYKDLTISSPSQYLITTSKPSILKTLDKIYRIVEDSQTFTRVLRLTSNKLYYVYNITEISKNIDDTTVITYLDTYSPAILNPNNYDIAVVPSMISFSEYSPNNRRNSKDSTIKFGGKFDITNPQNTINYNNIANQYYIRSGDGYKILSYTSSEKNNKSIVKAMTFNQGYFETWCQQNTGGRHCFGYNTGGSMNFWRFNKIYPKD